MMMMMMMMIYVSALVDVGSYDVVRVGRSQISTIHERGTIICSGFTWLESGQQRYA